jgi:hypothetical protein
MDLMMKEGYEYDYVFDWTIVDKIEKPIMGNLIEKKIGGNRDPSMNVENPSADFNMKKKEESNI